MNEEQNINEPQSPAFLQGAVMRSAIPQDLIRQAIGISKCITEAVNNRLPTRIIRMYAEESERINAKCEQHYA